MLRAAEAEAQAEVARAMIGADMGPDVNSATSPVHGARNHKGCPAVAKRKAPDLFVQVRGPETLDINYSHSIVKNSLQFVPVCRSLLQFVPFTSSLKNRHESMGSNLGHGFSGHPRRFRGSRWVTANCEQQLLATWTLYFRGGWGRRNSAKPSPSKLARDARSSFAPPRESSCCSVWL